MELGVKPMIVFSTSAIATGPTDGVLQSAITTFTNNGFAITQHDSTSALLTGPGLHSTKQNPILGISSVTLRLHESELVAVAELGGVDSMRRFLIRFPLLLGIGLGLFFGIGGGFLFGQHSGVVFGVPWASGWHWLIVAMGGAMLPVLPWLVLAPLISGMVRKRTEKSLETLVKNATWTALSD